MSTTASVLPPAFASPTVLNVAKRFPAPLRTPVPRCQAAPPTRKARLFTTGQRLTLRPSATSTVAETAPRYLVCPNCDSAYVGNAVTARIRVSCPSCSTVFEAAPTDLYVAATQSEVDAQRKKAHPNAVICPHIKKCSGCSVRGDAAAPPLLREANDFLSQYLVRDRDGNPLTALTSEMGAPNGWRTHAKLAIRRSRRASGRLALGLFLAGSHELLPIPECGVHAPEISRAAALVEDVLRSGNVTAYDETSGNGNARYALFTVKRDTRRVQVTLVWNTMSWKQGAPLVVEVGRELWRRGGRDLLHSLWFNWNTTSTNTIINPERERFYHAEGEALLVDSVCGVELTFPPHSFRQANLDAFETLLLPKLLSYIPRESRVVELCAGVGVIGLVALKQRKLRSLRASEIHAGAEGEFWRAARKLMRSGDVDKDAEIVFQVGSDADTLEQLMDEETDVLIVDPPRGGLSAPVVELLASPDTECTKGLRRLVYISCGFSAFKRDARALCADIEWRLVAGHTYVLFPGSDQVETLAIFDRNTRARRGGREPKTARQEKAPDNVKGEGTNPGQSMRDRREGGRVGRAARQARPHSGRADDRAGRR